MENHNFWQLQCAFAKKQQPTCGFCEKDSRSLLEGSSFDSRVDNLHSDIYMILCDDQVVPPHNLWPEMRIKAVEYPCKLGYLGD